jgi:hypothetical protein
MCLEHILLWEPPTSRYCFGRPIQRQRPALWQGVRSGRLERNCLGHNDSEIRAVTVIVRLARSTWVTSNQQRCTRGSRAQCPAFPEWWVQVQWRSKRPPPTPCQSAARGLWLGRLKQYRLVGGSHSLNYLQPLCVPCKLAVTDLQIGMFRPHPQNLYVCGLKKKPSHFMFRGSSLLHCKIRAASH